MKNVETKIKGLVKRHTVQCARVSRRYIGDLLPQELHSTIFLSKVKSGPRQVVMSVKSCSAALLSVIGNYVSLYY